MANPTSVTQYQTAVAPELAPYVQQSLGSQAARTYKYETDANGQTVLDESGLPKIAGFQEAPVYTGERNAAFQDLQNQSFQGAKDLGVSGTSVNAAQGLQGLAQQAGTLNYQGTQYNPQDFQSQMGGYMNPYLQQSLAPQLAEANRQYDISGQKSNAQAVGAGAFGGSRQGLMAAENERNRNMGLNSIIGQGYNTAFNNAQQQYNQTNALNTNQQQFGANYQLQGLQAGLSGYGALGSQGQNLYNQNVGNITMQNQMGTQQQQNVQNIANTDYQTWLDSQNYAQKNMDTMQSYIRGTPMNTVGSSTTAAAPSTASQIAGLGTAAAGAYGMYKSMGNKKGGAIKAKKPAAGGLEALALSQLA